MGHETLGNTAGYERLDGLSAVPPMEQDQVLDSCFFPLLFDDSAYGMKDLISRIPVMDYKKQF